MGYRKVFLLFEYSTCPLYGSPQCPFYHLNNGLVLYSDTRWQMPWMFGDPVQLSNCPFQVGEITHKKKKVDEMSLATKERLRIERERVIKEYRNLKKKNFPLWSTTFYVEYKKSKTLLLFCSPFSLKYLKTGGKFFIYVTERSL